MAGWRRRRRDRRAGKEAAARARWSEASVEDARSAGGRRSRHDRRVEKEMAVRAMDRGGGEGGERRGSAFGGREEDWARLARESKESGGARDGVGEEAARLQARRMRARRAEG